MFLSKFHRKSKKIQVQFYKKEKIENKLPNKNETLNNPSLR